MEGDPMKARSVGLALAVFMLAPPLAAQSAISNWVRKTFVTRSGSMSINRVI